jgi:transposase
MITGERGAGKLARPVREEDDGKGPTPQAPRRRPTSLGGRAVETHRGQPRQGATARPNWRPSRIGVDRAVTIMVDLPRDQDGCLHARLLDAVVGRSGTVYKAWLKAQPGEFVDGVETAALDPYRGYANAIRDGLPDAVAVLDAFHVVRLGTQVVDEVRRRVQQDTLGRRGHKHDPLYKIRGLLRHGVEHLTDNQQAKISACLDAGDPTAEVDVAWQCYQQLRSIYHAAPAKGREIAAKVLDSFHTCPIPEVARLGRTLRAWRAQVLAYFDTSGVSTGGTEAICECRGWLVWDWLVRMVPVALPGV